MHLATGAVRWEVPLGVVPEASTLPESSAWGSPNPGGSLITGGGLVFIGAAMDTPLHAFDVETGKELWKGELPASARATPMTYRLSEQGKLHLNSREVVADKAKFCLDEGEDKDVCMGRFTISVWNLCLLFLMQERIRGAADEAGNHVPILRTASPA